MKKIVKYLVFGMIALLGILYLYVKYSGVSEGEQAPDFETTLVDGSEFKLSDLQGKYVLLDFWGSWCPPCRRENPKLVELHEKYANKLTIVTVALEKDTVHWKRVAQKDGFTWKNQIVHHNKYVLLSPIAREYGVTEIPAKFLISPDGKLIGKYSFEQINNLLSK